MGNNIYRLDPEAIIRSLRCTLLVPRNYSATVTRLQNAINRLPEGRLQITHTHGGVSFYKGGKYLRKNSDLLYSLARKRYCEALLQVITLLQHAPDHISAEVLAYGSDRAKTSNRVKASDRPKTSNRLKTSDLAKAVENLERLIRDFSKGNLRLERIILTQQQYGWYCRRYKKKKFIREKASPPLLIPQGDPVRSKSEQSIGDELHYYAVPCHYEEELLINVQRLVRSLTTELQQRNQLPERLFTYQGYSCVWNVPADLAWMNAPGSIWRSYDDRTGCLRLHPDYTIMLMDGSLLYWEHEGLLHQFYYRMNALERIEVMHQSGGISRKQIIETNEAQANEKEILREIIRRQILPRLWF